MKDIDKLHTKLTRDEAIELAGSEWWKGLPARDVALAQLQQDYLCMPFGEFHRVVEDAAGRAVFSHEFVNAEHIAREIDPSLPEPSEPRKTLTDMMDRNAKVIGTLTKSQQEAERVTLHKSAKPLDDNLQYISIIAGHVRKKSGLSQTAALELAEAIPGLLERIADLEDDVERLRPKEGFKPVRLFEVKEGDRNLVVETEPGGGLDFESENPDLYICVSLTNAQGIELAAALTKWAESK
jgi:hypothetical protein